MNIGSSLYIHLVTDALVENISVNHLMFVKKIYVHLVTDAVEHLCYYFN